MNPLGKMAGNGPGSPESHVHRDVTLLAAVNGVLTAKAGVLKEGGRA